MTQQTVWNWLRGIGIAASYLLAVASHAALVIPNIPLTAQQTAKPMVMLVAGKDHRMFYEAYNDASDVDGDGTLDIRYKPNIQYFGMFDSNVCYTHSGGATNSDLFTPVRNTLSALVAGVPYSCNSTAASGGPTPAWSGNWLNYITTSRIDALRGVLYGGMREVDTATQTILRRAYIPQDAHSWAKEYTSIAVDKYDIRAFTPLSLPTPSGRRHFFGSLTPNAGVNCANLTDCSNLPPWLSVVVNSDRRVWNWASKERPVLDDGSHGGTRTNYTVRVEVCTTSFNGGCKQYPNGNYKPIGILHEYGENESMLFGLMSGSFDRSTEGGRLRKVVSSFRNEVNTTTGVFTADAAIVKSFNALRIRDFNNGRNDNAYRSGWVTTRPPTPTEFADWGNPIAELMYEALRYYAGSASPTSTYMGSTTIDASMGLPIATWDDPYSPSGAAKGARCARPNLMVLSDTNVSYDSNSLPGVSSAFASPTFSASSLGSFNAATEANFISANEPGAVGLRFIGQVGTTFDSAPSPKMVAGFGNIRGLAPEEPTKQGSYYSAAVAHYGKKTDLRPDVAGKQSVDTFVVALASPLPRIEVPMPGGKKITLVPFAKSVGGGGISAAKTSYQPTNQIVDFYVQTIANSGPSDADPSVNGGRYYAEFSINYEDVEQGADHDMDAIVIYKVFVNAAGQLVVNLRPTYQAGGIQHRMGYIISGTTKDGVYLEVQDESDAVPYFLNTPPGLDPGACDVASPPAACNLLPRLGGPAGSNEATRTFTVGSGAAASLLKDPLWYAAKWGGFIDQNNNDKPDLLSEWSTQGNGDPDTYLLVQNPLKLKEALRRTLDNISARSSSASGISANGQQLKTSSKLYQAKYGSARWSGELFAYAITRNGLGSTPAWQASQALPAPNARLIFYRDSNMAARRLTTWASMTAADQTATISQNVVNFLKGDRSQERQNGGSLRERDHALGAIIHSSPVYDKQSDIVYVNANDGMLHAFDATNGQEWFAFIPRSSMSKLGSTSSANYQFQFVLDGEIAVSERSAYSNASSYLYSALGRAGKGMFSLNVTSPRSFTATNALWEYTPAASPVAASDPNLGLMLGVPVIVPLNNNKLGVLIGNGYNSVNETAALYIFVINADGTLSGNPVVLNTGVSGDNGLGGVATTDINGDGKADYAFAGDLKGNMWRFDLTGSTTASWTISFSAQPLFVAKDATGNPQPITGSPFVALNSVTGSPTFGKRFVFFGTGSYFKQGDATDTSTQSIYGIVGHSSVGDARITAARDVALKERTFPVLRTIDGVVYRALSKAVAGDMSGKSGWFFDLPVSRERATAAPQFVNIRAQLLLAPSFWTTDVDPCVPSGDGIGNFIDPFTGAAPAVPFFDVDPDNDGKGLLDGYVITGYSLGIGVVTNAQVVTGGGRVQVFFGGSGGGEDGEKSIARSSFDVGGRLGRISWREIVND